MPIAPEEDGARSGASAPAGKIKGEEEEEDDDDDEFNEVAWGVGRGAWGVGAMRIGVQPAMTTLDDNHDNNARCRYSIHTEEEIALTHDLPYPHHAAAGVSHPCFHD